MEDLIRQTLADLAVFLRANDAPFAVIGGIAVSVRGEPRFTADIDATVGIDVDAALLLLRSTGGSPFAPLLKDEEEIVRRAFILPLRHRRTGIKVDLAIGMTGFERGLIGRASNESFGELSIPVATSEDLILMKVIAGRPRDLEDVRGIVARSLERLDWRYLMETGRQLGEAIGQDLASTLRSLRGEPGGP